MIAELADLRGDLAPDGPLQRAVVEKRDVLRPRQPDHDAQPVARGRVEQLAARRRVGADRVDAERGHQAEVGGDLLQRRELVAVRVGRERPVGHAFDEEALVAGAQKLSVGHDARRREDAGLAPDVRVGLNGSAHSWAVPSAQAEGTTTYCISRLADYRSILTLPLKVLNRSVPPSPPPPSSALSARRLELCIVSGISEFRRPLNELKVTVPRALSGTCSSMLPLKVSTSIDLVGFPRLLPDGDRAAEGVRLNGAGQRRSGPAATRSRGALCGPSTPVTLTGELKTDRSRWVRRGTLMSKSVSTTLLPLAKSHHERSRWLASTTTTFEPDGVDVELDAVQLRARVAAADRVDRRRPADPTR